MEFAFYKASGELHDAQELISGESINPATNEKYSVEGFDYLDIYSTEEIIGKTKLLKYLAKNYPSDLILAILDL